MKGCGGMKRLRRTRHNALLSLLFGFLQWKKAAGERECGGAVRSCFCFIFSKTGARVSGILVSGIWGRQMTFSSTMSPLPCLRRMLVKLNPYWIRWAQPGSGSMRLPPALQVGQFFSVAKDKNGKNCARFFARSCPVDSKAPFFELSLSQEDKLYNIQHTCGLFV